MKTIKKNLLAVIPARSGSKRLPGKNILKVNGKPLISWTIESAQQAEIIDTICISTDSDEIAHIAEKKYGLKVPFKRPLELASDQATTIDVLLHAVDFYNKSCNIIFNYILLLQPTSPLRNFADIVNAYNELKAKNADSIVSVCEVDHSPLWVNQLGAELSMEYFYNSAITKQRPQDHNQYYRLNGAIYLVNCKRFVGERSLIFNNKSVAYIMPKNRSVDIDTIDDLNYASFLLNNRA